MIERHAVFPYPQSAADLQFVRFAVHPEVKRLRRFTQPYLEVESFDHVAALPGCIKHRTEKNLGLLGLMKKSDEHRLCHAQRAPSQQSEPCHRNGQNEGDCRDEERNNCHAPLYAPLSPVKNFFISKPIPPTLGCRMTASTSAPATPRRIRFAARNLDSCFLSLMSSNTR